MSWHLSGEIRFKDNPVSAIVMCNPRRIEFSSAGGDIIKWGVELEMFSEGLAVELSALVLSVLSRQAVSGVIADWLEERWHWFTDTDTRNWSMMLAFLRSEVTE